MTIEKTTLLPVATEEAFALLTQPERLRRWLAVSVRMDLRAGGVLRWTLTPAAVATGTVIEIEPGRRIVLSYGGEHTVTITVEPVDGGTLVRLVHKGLPEDQADSVDQGWTHFLGRLERAAATGDAGPDEWAFAPEDLYPLTSANATLAVLQHVLRSMGQDDLHRSTPCRDFTVSQLEAHLLQSLSGLTSLAGSTLTPSSSKTLESRVADAAQQAVESWTERGLEGTVQAGPQQMPAALAAAVLSVEFLVHAWDFARATDQHVRVSDDVASYVLGLAEQIITPDQRKGAGFDPALPASHEAPVLDRLVAFTGRQVAPPLAAEQT